MILNLSFSKSKQLTFHRSINLKKIQFELGLLPFKVLNYKFIVNAEEKKQSKKRKTAGQILK